MSYSKLLKYMEIAKAVAGLSKDSTKVGAIILDAENRPVSFGYNGFIKGIEDELMPVERPEKYGVTCHAEMDAVLFAQRSLVGCKLFVTHSPCDNCLKYILQAGIREVYYLNEYPFKNDEAINTLKEATKDLIYKKLEEEK